MSLNFYFGAVAVLVLFAMFDLIVGVSNDAINFLNPSIGSRAASRRMILLVASLGILAGVTFSSGMMEVARKGIFHPEFFTMPNLLTIFLAVMITDIILLDTFSSNGLPTSTTVSVVFELLGAAVAVSLLKISQANGALGLLGDYINTSRALMIIGGIFFAVVVAFVTGAVIQFLSRLLFSFQYEKTVKRYGALWGGMAMTAVLFFILIKGAKGASFMTPENIEWINGHTLGIMAGIFIVSAVLLEGLLLAGFNIFKPIVLFGTFALAMAFAANDLVNFIGVPMAGWNAYCVAVKSTTPFIIPMAALSGKVPASTWVLLLAGGIMVATLWFSRKARTVISTGVDLSQQDEGEEQFEASFLSRTIVRGVLNMISTVRMITPAPLRSAIARRFDSSAYQTNTDDDQRPSFDLLRAAVNIMVASALISYGTSHKLPLSTTYVTFMVAMGASFADQAWGRESAVYRVTGVLTVVGGWLLTALIAFSLAALMATAIFYGKGFVIVALLVLDVAVIWMNHGRHAKRLEMAERGRIFNLRKVTDLTDTVTVSFSHISQLLQILAESLDQSIEGLFNANIYVLRKEKSQVKQVRKWTNIIIANVFKSLRLLQRQGSVQERNYLQIVRRLQKLSDGHTDIVSRAYEHVANHHKGLLDEQVKDLRKLKIRFIKILVDVRKHIDNRDSGSADAVREKVKALKLFSRKIQHRQLDRIQSGEAKTRLNILFFALAGNLYMVANQGHQLLKILDDSFKGVETGMDADND